MLHVRFYRSEELPLIIERAVDTALAQLVARELPGASRFGVAMQNNLMYEHALAVPHATVIVADAPPGTAGDGPVGHALLMPQPNPFTAEPELVVMDIYTHPAWRGKGVGRLLVENAAAYARDVGSHSLVAQVALQNEASLALFRSAGFERERVMLGRRL